ncbi:MAG: C25 family cysteine peptidase [Rhodanobacteraceae bacterium]
MTSRIFFSYLALISAGIMSAALPARACSGRLHLETGPTGVYSLDFKDAIAAQPGLAGCDIRQLRLLNHGKEVPIRILDTGDRQFGQGDRIEWVGRKLHGPKSWSDPYSRVNVYELDAVPGKRLRYLPRKVDARQHKTATLSRHMHLENDQLMIRLKTSQVDSGEQPDVWYWAKMTMVDPRPFQTRFNLPAMRDNPPNPTLKLAFRGLSTVKVPTGKEKVADHRVIAMLNGKQIAELEWDGEDHIERTLVLPPKLLRQEGNTLTLSVPSRQPGWARNPLVDVVMFDYLDMSYPLADRDTRAREPLDVQTAGAPMLGHGAPLLFGSDGALYLPLARRDGTHYAFTPAGTRLFPLAKGHTPLSPVALRAVADKHDWRKPSAGYDYVIIAHPSLMKAIEPLAEFHRKRGLSTAIVNVNEAYDQFNHGITNPTAIRDLLSYAYHNWPRPRPHYVLLVGDASFDIHDKLRKQQFYSKWTDRELLFPGHFGRIPGTPYANAPKTADARNLIPTFQYFAHEGQSASDNAFVAFDKDSDKPQMAIGRFPVITPKAVSAIVDKTINYVSKPRMGNWRQSIMFITNDDPSFQETSDRLAAEVGDLGFSPSRIYPKTSDKDNARHQQKLMQDLDQGQLLVHFLGHGGRYIWRTGPPDPRKNHDLFTLKNVGELKNAGRLPMVLSMTCYSAPFDNPTEDSIGEKFLREKDNGAIAVFAASWRNAPDVDFSKHLLRDLVKPGISIGDAILAAKRGTSNRDMIEMYNLLGDPAIALQRPREKLRMVQVRKRWNPGVAISVPGASSFHGRLRVEWLDNEHELLSSRTYAIDTPQLRLPPAPAGAHQVRAYAFDPSRKTDALGELTLRAARPERPWWKLAPRAKPLQPASDRIFGSNLGG